MDKKLLQINVCNNALSTGKIASDIGELAMENGWKSYIAYSSEGSFRPSRNLSIKVGNKIDYYTHVVEARLFDNQGLGLSSIIATKRLIEAIDESTPSIIHLHIIHGYFLNLPVLFNYLKTLNIPIVWTIHSCWEFTGHCGFFDTIGCDKWKIGCHHCPQYKNYPTSWFRDRSKKNYLEKKRLFNSINNLTLVPVSKWLGGLLHESFLKNHNIFPIYNGVDTSVFSPSTSARQFRKLYGLESKFIAIGVASTWEPRKNMKDYVRLSKMLPDNMKLILVGLNKQEKDSLPSNILGLPRTKTTQELVDIYSAADVVLNLSLEETFGLTTVEGFACGTPGIVYNCTASPELISEDTGFVVEPGDIDGVLQCMKIISNKGKESYSSNCRQRAISSFDKNTNYHQYLELYNKLIHNVSI